MHNKALKQRIIKIIPIADRSNKSRKKKKKKRKDDIRMVTHIEIIIDNISIM